MKIIESNSNILRLRSDPYFAILFGLIFGLSAIAVMFFFGRSYELHCERTVSGQKASANQITCMIDEKLLGITRINERTIVDIRRAEVEEYQDSDGDDTYKVILITANGRESLTSFSSSGYRSKADLAYEINSFIDGGRQNSLDITIPMAIWLWLFPIMFGGVAVGSLFLARTVVVEFSRPEGLLRIQKDGIFGCKQEEYPLKDVEDAYLAQSRDSDGSTYRIVIRLVDGEEIPLSWAFSSGYKRKQKAVDAINEFMQPYSSQRQAREPFA